MADYLLCYNAIVLCWPVSWPAKCCTKICLDFKNNTVGHTTFRWGLTCLLGLLFMCLHCLCCLIPIHVYCSFDFVVTFNAIDVLVLSCIFSCLAYVLINVPCNCATVLPTCGVSSHIPVLHSYKNKMYCEYHLQLLCNTCILTNLQYYLFCLIPTNCL